MNEDSKLDFKHCEIGIITLNEYRLWDAYFTLHETSVTKAKGQYPSCHSMLGLRFGQQTSQIESEYWHRLDQVD